jgi:hypothetical protein
MGTDLKNEFSWSCSRDRLFRDCRRAYYYQYYASWGGWDSSADELARKAYILKNVKSIDMWIGDTVHQIIKGIVEGIKEGKTISLDEALTRTKLELRKTWEQSRNAAWKVNIKHNLNLFEHYYGKEITNDEVAAKVGKAAECMRNLYASGILDSFRDIPADGFLSIDQFDAFELEGVKIFAIPDLVVRDRRGLMLFDWKTGKTSDDDVFQLSFYVLYAVYKWRIAADEVSIIPFYLMSKGGAKPVTPVATDAVKSYLRESLAAMRSTLADITQNQADISKCPRTTQNWRCQSCKFKEICIE